jgi:hypothetical protein
MLASDLPESPESLMFSSRYPGTIVPAASDIASNWAVTPPIAKYVGSGSLCDSTQANFPRDFDGSITPTTAMCESLRAALVPGLLAPSLVCLCFLPSNASRCSSSTGQDCSSSYSKEVSKKTLSFRWRISWRGRQSRSTRLHSSNPWTPPAG